MIVYVHLISLTYWIYMFFWRSMARYVLLQNLTTNQGVGGSNPPRSATKVSEIINL